MNCEYFPKLYEDIEEASNFRAKDVAVARVVNRLIKAAFCVIITADRNHKQIMGSWLKKYYMEVAYRNLEHRYRWPYSIQVQIEDGTYVSGKERLKKLIDSVPQIAIDTYLAIAGLRQHLPAEAVEKILFLHADNCITPVIGKHIR